jgi:hypothetical protein
MFGGRPATGPAIRCGPGSASVSVGGQRLASDDCRSLDDKLDNAADPPAHTAQAISADGGTCGPQLTNFEDLTPTECHEAGLP